MTIAVGINCHPKPEDVRLKTVGEADYWLCFEEPKGNYGSLDILIRPGTKAAILKALSEIPDHA